MAQIDKNDVDALGGDTFTIGTFTLQVEKRPNDKTTRR